MEEEKIIKPPFGFTFQLFILMLFLILQFVRLYQGIPKVSIDSLTGYSFETIVLSAVTDLILYFYAFVGIFKALKRTPQSITILKFALFYLILQAYFSVTNDVSSDIRNLIVFWIHPLSLMFYIFMYVYLFKSRKLKEYIPKNERTFGLAGGVGILIYMLSIGLYVYTFGLSFYKGYKSLPKDPAELKLNKGEYTDGMVIFKPLDDWKCDTVYKASEYSIIHVFNSDKYSDIIITTIPGVYTNKLDYYFLLSQCGKEYIGDSIKLKEICYGDSIINGNQYHFNTYIIGDNNEADKIYWTYSSLIPKDYNKSFAISAFERGNNTFHYNLPGIFKNVEFNLEKRRAVNN